MTPAEQAFSYVESSLPPGLPLPKYRELRVQHAPVNRAYGHLMQMVAAVYGGRRDDNNGFKYEAEGI